MREWGEKSCVCVFLVLSFVDAIRSGRRICFHRFLGFPSAYGLAAFGQTALLHTPSPPGLEDIQKHEITGCNISRRIMVQTT